MSAATLRSFPAASLVISSAFLRLEPPERVAADASLCLQLFLSDKKKKKKEGKTLCDLVTFATGRRGKEATL